jgi:hypothetical protein
MNVLETLTAFEMMEVEKAAGVSIATLEDPNYPKAGILTALGWVVAKRENKSLLFTDFAATTTLKEINESLGLDDEEAA